MAQYWEVWFADGEIVRSTDYSVSGGPHCLPNKRVLLILQPYTYERTGWKDRLVNTNHVFFRTDLDCWTEHDASSVWALEEMKDHAHVISCYRQGKWQGNFKALRARAESRYRELMNG